MAEGETGEILYITGTVYANDCETPLPNAIVDIWHASEAGAYNDVKTGLRSLQMKIVYMHIKLFFLVNIQQEIVIDQGISI